jgi:uncharacterized protein (DUF58 family)
VFHNLGKLIRSFLFSFLMDKKVSDKGEFSLNIPGAIARFENAMQKFPVKKILYKNIFRGKGLEFDAYRLFEPDDDANLIDWKASLRANQILTKKYIEERDLNVYFLVDASNSMLFGSGNQLKAEFAAEFCCSLGHLVLGAGDNVGLLMFSDDVVKFLPASRTRNQFALFAKYLSDSSFYGGGFDLDKAIQYALRMVSTPYTVFILVSDFIRTRPSNLEQMRLMGVRYESLAIMLRDPLDDDLPDVNYQFAVQDPYTGRQMVLDPGAARERYKKSVAKHKAMVREMLKSSRMDLLELSTNQNFVAVVSGFLRARSKGSRV